MHLYLAPNYWFMNFVIASSLADPVNKFQICGLSFRNLLAMHLNVLGEITCTSV